MYLNFIINLYLWKMIRSHVNHCHQYTRWGIFEFWLVMSQSCYISHLKTARDSPDILTEFFLEVKLRVWCWRGYYTKRIQLFRPEISILYEFGLFYYFILWFFIISNHTLLLSDNVPGWTYCFQFSENTLILLN